MPKWLEIGSIWKSRGGNKLVAGSSPSFLLLFALVVKLRHTRHTVVPDRPRAPRPTIRDLCRSATYRARNVDKVG